MRSRAASGTTSRRVPTTLLQVIAADSADACLPQLRELAPALLGS